MSTQTPRAHASTALDSAPGTGRPSPLLLLGLSLGYFMVLLDTTIVTVALPSISASLHGSLSSLQWVSNGYTLTFAALLLTAGALSDKFGGKRVFLVGLGAFAVISGVSAAAGSIGMLITMRTLLGIAGAALLPTSLAIIANSYTDPAARAKALGGWAAITGMALAAGPVIGGVLTDTVGWRAIFLVNVPVALVSIVLTAKFAKETVRRASRGIDLGGQLAAIVALAGLTYGLIQSAPLGWTSPSVLGAFAVAVVAGIVFVLLERRDGAMLPVGLFRIRTFSAGLLAGLLVNFGLSGALFVLSLFFQETRGYSAIIAGVAFLPLTLPTAFNPIFTGRLVAKIGPRVPSVIGFLLMAAGVLIQVPFTSNSPVSVVMSCVGLLLLGFGVSFAIPSLITAIVGAVPKEQTGIGSGALNSARQTGAVLGVAILGAVIGAYGGSATGTAVSLAIIGVLLLVGAITVGTSIGRPAKVS
ncbi:MFS transporter [Amycolatopsis sp. H20-H5]|uniref:MFS transporter n=1 Tax=Amycolatopsis sp. H20-H5 TaxID=3046309 RepID=UPI002DBFAD16|nr:MFS transporter [Amycolatopsis sp. H20-H5]MEC3982034.1 MFS transporter [Amycolatopsis sp. H20-H5]